MWEILVCYFYRMLYLVGDSNSVYTAPFLSREDVDTSLCKCGLTSTDILSLVTKKKKDLSKATSFFVFCGMNDEFKGEMTASVISDIVSYLRSKASSLPILLALPFCVQDEASNSRLKERLKAASILASKEDEERYIVVSDHVTKDMKLKKQYVALRKNSSRLDTLHLNKKGYESIAKAIDKRLKKGEGRETRKRRKR